MRRSRACVASRRRERPRCRPASRRCADSDPIASRASSCASSRVLDLAPHLHLLHYCPNGAPTRRRAERHDEENIGHRHCSPGSHRCGACATVGAGLPDAGTAAAESFPPAYAPPPGYKAPPAAAPRAAARAAAARTTDQARRTARRPRTARRRPTARPRALPAAQLLLSLSAAAPAPGDRSAVHARRRHRLRRARVQGRARPHTTDSGMAYTFRLGFGLRPGLLLLWDVEGALVNRNGLGDFADGEPRGAADVRQPAAVLEGRLRSRAGRPDNRTGA